MNFETLKNFKEWGYDQKATAAFFAAAIFAILVMSYVFALMGSIALEKRAERQSIADLLARAQSVPNVDVESQDTEGQWFEGNNLAQIQSEIQSQVQRIGDKYFIALDSVQALNPNRSDSLVVNQLRLIGSIPEENFALFLEELITETPPIFPVDFDIRSIPQRSSRQFDDGASAPPPELSFRLTVSAIAKDDPSFGF